MAAENSDRMPYGNVAPLWKTFPLSR